MFTPRDIRELETALGGDKLLELRRDWNRHVFHPNERLQGGDVQSQLKELKTILKTNETLLKKGIRARGATPIWVSRDEMLNRDHPSHKLIKDFVKSLGSSSPYTDEVLLNIGLPSDNYIHLFKCNANQCKMKKLRGKEQRQRHNNQICKCNNSQELLDSYVLKERNISAARGAYIAVAINVNLEARKQKTHKREQEQVVAFCSGRTFHFQNTTSWFAHARKEGDIPEGDPITPSNVFIEPYDDVPVKARETRKGRTLELHLVAAAQTPAGNESQPYAKQLGNLLAMMLVNKMQGVKLDKRYCDEYEKVDVTIKFDIDDNDDFDELDSKKAARIQKDGTSIGKLKYGYNKKYPEENKITFSKYPKQALVVEEDDLVISDGTHQATITVISVDVEGNAETECTSQEECTWDNDKCNTNEIAFRYKHLLAEQYVPDLSKKDGLIPYKVQKTFDMKCVNKLKDANEYNDDDKKVKFQVSSNDQKFVPKHKAFNDVIYWGSSRKKHKLTRRRDGETECTYLLTPSMVQKFTLASNPILLQNANALASLNNDTTAGQIQQQRAISATGRRKNTASSSVRVSGVANPNATEETTGEYIIRKTTTSRP